MKHLLTALLTAALLCLVGCQSEVTVRKVGSDGRMDYEDTFVFASGLSADTINFLGNHLLRAKMEYQPDQFIIDLEQLCKDNPSPRTFIAMAETSQLLAARYRENPDTAVRYDLTTLFYSQKHLQYSLENRSARLFDPEVIVAVKCYNLALSNLFAYLQERDLHNKGVFELTAAGGQTIHFEMPKYTLPVKQEHILKFMICADYRPVNLTHNSRRFGIGVPLICELENNAIPETVFAEGQVIPATLAFKIDLTPSKEQRFNARLYYLDSRSMDTVNLKNIAIPIAQDFSTPLGYMVKDPPPFDFLQRTFQVELTSHYEGLYHLEPHNDNRIPIVLVHGLLSDIRTWLQLINTLQSDPELRQHYRFMGFSYSSGNPIFISAMQLRNSLYEERERLKRDGHDLKNFDQMVLIGHSMGGLLSRLMISTSDEDILSSFIGQKISVDDLGDDAETFMEAMIFAPVPSVKRVIFIAVPHRGSNLAKTWYGKLASAMIEIPESLLAFNAALLKQIIGFSDDKKQEILESFNGIDNLSPDGTALKLLNTMPLSQSVPYHSIIGNEEKRGVPGGSDGVVPYSSSHLDYAQSEIVVKSGHSVQQNPLAIQEIKRILIQHIKQMNNE